MFPSKILWEVVSQPFKRSQLGLFQGKTKQYGNNVPFSKHKTRRTWLPNVQQKRVPSELLGGNVKLKLTTRALRTIKKKGGLDQYLLETSANLLGHEGMRLRQLALDARRVKEGRKALPKLELLSEEECREEKHRIMQEKYDSRVRALQADPSYPLVRRARELAARAFGADTNPMPGEDGLASPEATIAWLKERQFKLARSSTPVS
ncbi:hypothetical protein CVT24_010368 [Panaeolus cyanescens]|uniref:Large ribosomal subunit protein bL28c n=1 Tax=Panaeolus cyanescens TaxID=181874 RepID=A0A409VAI8_9AGAR|nr:hypothetical protein CVT24_010368 [Panaeolus cyanescens]